MHKCSQAALRIAPLLVVLVAGCATTPQEGLISTVEGTEITERELRAQVDELIRQFSGGIERETSRIFYESKDPEVRRMAIISAIRINEILVRAEQHDDALIALIDVWAFASQLCDFLDTGAGRDLFGEHQQAALAAAQRMERSAGEVAEEIGGDLLREDASAQFEQWVMDHPMEGGLYRRSIAPESAALTTPKGRSVFSVSETVEQSLDRLTRRIDALNYQLPKQIVWRAAVLIEYQLEAIEELAAGLRPLVAEERATIMQEVERQRTETLEAIDRQRVATIDAIGLERQSVFTGLEAVVNDTFGRLEQQRSAAIEDVNVLLAGAVQDAQLNANDVVDYVFWRALLLIAAGFVAGLVLVIVLRASRRPA
jgi:hypothetical protein